MFIQGSLIQLLFTIKIAFLKQVIQKKAWNIFRVKWMVFSQEKTVSERALIIQEVK